MKKTPGILHSLIMARLGGNRRLFNTVRLDKPVALGRKRSAAVVGGGIAGLTAAAILAERGFKVKLFEKKGYPGGKAGSRKETLAGGFEAQIDHGFHGVFRQYYNFRALLERFGSNAYLKPIQDYLILGRDGRTFSFKDVSTTPLLNMAALRKTGLYRLGEMMGNPGSRRLLAFLGYDRESTFSRYDDMDFEDFCNSAGTPPSMRVMFNTFSRSFFSDADMMSTAEVIKSFHFYYLSNDLGLLYDYFAADYQIAFTDPAMRRLSSLGVDVRLSHPVGRIERRNERLHIDGDAFDYVIMAADVIAARSIAANSPFLREEDPLTFRNMGSLKSSQGYAVMKVWLDRPFNRDVPPFMTTDRIRMLDSITLNHFIDPESAAWARENSGSVLELHAYALPREGAAQGEVRDALLSEMRAHLSELAGARVLHEHLEIGSDFPAFHTGMSSTRPGATTRIPDFFLCGDWVKLPLPAMLMEAACTSALLATNAVFDSEGLRQEPVWSVPEKGLFAKR